MITKRVRVTLVATYVVEFDIEVENEYSDVRDLTDGQLDQALDVLDDTFEGGWSIADVVEADSPRRLTGSIQV